MKLKTKDAVWATAIAVAVTGLITWHDYARVKAREDVRERGSRR